MPIETIPIETITVTYDRPETRPLGQAPRARLHPLDSERIAEKISEVYESILLQGGKVVATHTVDVAQDRHYVSGDIVIPTLFIVAEIPEEQNESS